MKYLISTFASVFLISAHLFAQSILITNVQVWDGTSDELRSADVLIESNLIKEVRSNIKAPKGATVIDGGGRTLMPGLIDMHTHLMQKFGVQVMRDEMDHAAAGAAAKESMDLYLQMGYTTLREVSGNTLGIARAVASNRISGPRIYSSGGAIGVISGHIDVATLTQEPGQDSWSLRGDANIVTGVDEVKAAARKIYRAGGTHLKLMIGGGVASDFDPLETTTMDVEEIRAAVQVAKDFGSYTCAHVYNDESVNRYLDAGGRNIEHGFLMKEETMKRMKDLDAVISLQSFVSYETFKEPEKIPGFSAENARKGRQVHEGADQMMKWVAKYKVRCFAGSDMWTYDLLPKVNEDLVVRKRWFDDVEILRQNTSYAAEQLAKSGPKNPYREGPLGVIAEGAYADLLVVEGNPLQDVSIFLDYRKNLKLIMKDGQVYKNTLQ